MLARLLYLGSGLGLTLLRRVRRAPPLRLPRREKLWLAGAVFAGGGVAPVLLMIGLARMPAAAASLLLNAEAVFTALLAWFAFRENVDRRLAAGMFAIVAGAALLSGPGMTPLGGAWPALVVLGACLAWALDNNLTRKVALHDATAIAAVKGLGVGGVNLGIALGLGFAAYGISLALFVVALRELGTARTGAYFSVAPFVGALLALLWLGESPSAPLLGAAALMALGVWSNLSERHVHEHLHEAIEQEHEHEHDAHHAHAHREARSPRSPFASASPRGAAPPARAFSGRAPPPSPLSIDAARSMPRSMRRVTVARSAGRVAAAQPVLQVRGRRMPAMRQACAT